MLLLGNSFLIFILAVPISLCEVEDQEHFHEEVVIRPLPTGDVLASFSFSTLSPVPADGVRRHFDLLPKFVGELIDDNRVYELDVTLSRGVWRTKLWGYPPRATASGAQVSAFFNPEVGDVDRAWTKLVNGLSGQFCASLNFLGEDQAVSPKWSFQPRGVIPDNVNGSAALEEYFRFGTLPGENVCTENLTPWKKLLPCESKKGLATLLNSHSIHKTKFHSLGFSVRNVCPDALRCRRPLVELNQNVVLVFDPATLYDNRFYPVKKHDWSLRNFFGIGILSSCPLASTSRIFVDIEDANSLSGKLIPVDIAENLTSRSGRKIYLFDVSKMVERGITNIQFVHEHEPAVAILKPPVMHATRYLVGHGHQKGGIVAKIFNSDAENPLTVVYLDVVPWFLRLFLHSLVIVDGRSGQSVLPMKLNFVPGVDRKRPYLLELVLKVPPKSHVEISIGFEHSLLKWLEYPPDANKGFYVGSSLVSSVVPTASYNLTSRFRHTSTYFETFNTNEYFSESFEVVQLYTESLLVNLPTPDFSMPYNVICLTCTVVALAFGPLHNITTKKLVLVKTALQSKGGPASSVVAKVRSFFTRTPPSQPNDEQSIEEDKKTK